jgi:hypothetical protein
MLKHLLPPKNVLKNCTLAALGLSALFLTCLLWFDKISNRTFFQTLFQALVYSAPESDQVREMMAPYRILTGYGSGVFEALYSGLAHSPQQTDCDEAIALALRAGQSAPVSWDALLAGPCHIYEYKTPLPTDITPLRAFPKGAGLAAQLSQFDWIVVAAEGDAVRVAFGDTGSRQAVALTAPAPALAARFRDNIALLGNYGAALYYTPLAPAPGGATLFVPQWRGQALTYAAPEILNPYMYQGDLLIAKIEKKVEAFFSNPALIVADKKDAFIYTAGTTVVKYLPNDTLEYSDYSTTEAMGKSSFAADYQAALAFAAKDASLENEYRMHSFLTEGDRTTFYFDFFINNFPILLPEKTFTETDLRHPLEVAVQNRKVVKYRKLVYVFKMVPLGTDVADIAFAHVPALLGPEGGPAMDVDTVEFGYKFEMNTLLRLNWFLGINGQTLVYGARR